MNKARIAFVCLVVVAALSLGGVALASSAGTATIGWHVFSAAGAPAAGAQISLNGSLGQPIAGPASLAGVSLQAGYWQRAVDSQYYLPLVLK
ncbi:MAG: hypothetical protein MUC51_15910 [Anaerolineae bacterium]|jgi:hypothetical protein|nr:hypothetical protein [Anaerolineae bacterium]